MYAERRSVFGMSSAVECSCLIPYGKHPVDGAQLGHYSSLQHRCCPSDDPVISYTCSTVFSCRPFGSTVICPAHCLHTNTAMRCMAATISYRSVTLQLISTASGAVFSLAITNVAQTEAEIRMQTWMQNIYTSREYTEAFLLDLEKVPRTIILLDDFFKLL